MFTVWRQDFKDPSYVGCRQSNYLTFLLGDVISRLTTKISEDRPHYGPKTHMEIFYTCIKELELRSSSEYYKP